MAQRDQALVNILERLADEMTQQDKMLADMLTRQKDLSKTVEAAGLHLRGGQTDAERSYDKLIDAISHYRSDMLSLVNEQDHINRNIAELEKVLKLTTYTVDVNNKKLIEMSERLSHIEKSSSEYIGFASKQPGIYRDALNDSSRNYTKLHAETEKRLSEFQRDIVRQLDSFQHETMRRLLLLDGIITSLQVLLTRTEPPEKKPLWIVRIAIRVRGFLRRRAAFLLRKKE